MQKNFLLQKIEENKVQEEAMKISWRLVQLIIKFLAQLFCSRQHSIKLKLPKENNYEEEISAWHNKLEDMKDIKKKRNINITPAIIKTFFGMKF